MRPFRVLTVAALAALLASVLPVASGQAAPTTASASAPAAVAAAAKATTKIVFIIRGCKRCSIGAERLVMPGSLAQPMKPRSWGGPYGRAVGGRLVLRVPTAYTSGMSFWLSAPWGENVTNARANLILGYPGLAAGTRVGAVRAAKESRALACWAGTSRATIRIHVRVSKVWGKVLGGGRGPTPRAWSSPTVRALSAPVADTWRGIVGSQDYFPC